MDNASKGAMQAAEQYGAEQDEAEERARIADAHGLNVGEPYFMQLLLEADGFEKGLSKQLKAHSEANERFANINAYIDIASFIIQTGLRESEKAITEIMQANADEAKRDAGDPA